EGALPEAKVAIVRSYDQGWAFEAQPNVPGLDYYGQLMKYHKAFYDRDIPVDFVREDADLSAYDLVIAPLQYLSDEVLAERYDAYVRGGGNLVLTMRSGVKDRDNICDDSRSLPGVFAKLLGISITEYDPLGKARVPISFSADCGKVSDFHFTPVEIFAEKCADVVTCDTAEIVAGYSGEWYAGQAAITVNMRGSGTAWYVGTEPDEAALNELISVIVEKTHILGKNPIRITHSEGVEVTSRVKNGEKWWFVLNHTGSIQEISVPENLKKEAGYFEDGKLGPYGYAVFSGSSDIEK
ncbi:MAG: beta-galactosidase trimerization domain-containing protein, partial [Lachnospiraceae bacterium]|nr:beta-galactosidase trimerization domain-containing protein [Lachnospiraceae bacterium]